MKTIRFAELLERLDGLDAWLDELNIKPKSYDRIHRAIRVVREADAGWTKFRETGEVTKIGNVADYPFGITEALEFSDIFEAFKDEEPARIGQKMRRALLGPLRPTEETQKNAEGRNLMFELALGAELKLRGASVSIGDPDLVLHLKEVPFYVECKRPSAEHAIRSNVRGAADQLAKKLDGHGGAGAMGIIAISVTRILNPGTQIFVTSTEQGKESLGNRLEELMHESEPCWLTIDDLHPRICAVVFHVATPAAVGQPGQDRLVRMTFTTVIPAGKKGSAFSILEEVLPLLFKDDQITIG